MGESEGNLNYDWNFTTVPQPSAAGRQISQPRYDPSLLPLLQISLFPRFRSGKLVGGSTGINLMAWDRASKAEYDSWAILGGAGGWDFNSLLPYFQKVEDLNVNQGDPYPGFSPSEGAAANQSFKSEDGYFGPIQVCHEIFISLETSLIWLSISRFLTTLFTRMSYSRL